MSASRPLGIRAYLFGAMVVLALASVAVTTLLINRAVDVELATFAGRDGRPAPGLRAAPRSGGIRSPGVAGGRVVGTVVVNRSGGEGPRPVRGATGPAAEGPDA